MTEFYVGSVECDMVSTVYHITHPNINILNSYPVVSLVVPTSADPLLIQGVTNRTISGFDVSLSSTPTASGFRINWQMNIPGTGPNEYINDKRYYSKEEVGHPKLSRIHWKNVIAAPDMSPQGLQNNHNHDNRYYTKSEIVNVIESQIEGTGSYTPIADTLMLRNDQGRCQVNTPKVSVDAANKGYVDSKDSIEAGVRASTDANLQTQIINISGSYATLAETQALEAQVTILESLVMSITGGKLYGGGNVPIGSIIGLATSTPPGVDWLFLDGSTLTVTAYPDLFAVIGYTFGGSGSTFNIPDSRGEFFRGWDAGRGVDIGRIFGSSQSDDFGYHTHSAYAVPAADHAHVISPTSPNVSTTTVASGSDTTVDTSTAGATATQPAGAHTHTISISGNGGVETRPRNVAISYFIKAYNPPLVEPVDLSSTQTISGQKTFVLPVIVPELPQAIIFGDPTATGTLALGIIGGQLVVTKHTSAGPWALINILG